jgi:hypothetical protein
MRIYIQCYLDRCMAKTFLDNLRVYSLLEH